MKEYDYKKLQNGSDIRGVAMDGVSGENVNLGKEETFRLTRGFAFWLSEKLEKPIESLKISVGHDSRLTAEELKTTIADTLVHIGVKVYDCGLASTPAMFMSTIFPEYACDGAIMITASHLPFNRNGFKYFDRDGGLNKSDIAEIITYAQSDNAIYNLKLVAAEDADMTNVVTNDLIFDREHRVYILTGANRGGKTTITQSIGQLFVLAQGGIYVPGEAFCFAPADNIYTHFPADEDKTFDLGRLGEECKRFKEMYADATKHSLFLMNETFSTTSFEEGYYIARDSVRAILKKGMRTIYNTHMHKLAFDIDEINEEDYDGKAFSLVVHNEGEKRSYKIEIAPPIGKSFASDIARKYGVTYEMLTEDKLV